MTNDESRRRARITRRRNARLGVPGRIRHRVAEMLSLHLGVYIDPTYIRSAQGYYRSSPDSDTYRWELISTGANIPILGCWETMTDFVRDGEKYGIDSDGREVWVKYPKKGETK